MQKPAEPSPQHILTGLNPKKKIHVKKLHQDIINLLKNLFIKEKT